jgi:hypothetical protein
LGASIEKDVYPEAPLGGATGQSQTREEGDREKEYDAYAPKEQQGLGARESKGP